MVNPDADIFHSPCKTSLHTLRETFLHIAMYANIQPGVLIKISLNTSESHAKFCFETDEYIYFVQ